MTKLLIFSFSFLLSVSAGVASTIQFTGLPGNTQYGTYNGYAFGSIDGLLNQQLICDDYDHTTYVPSGNLTYSLSELIGPNPLQLARFVDPSQPGLNITKYEEAAVLLNGLAQHGAGSSQDMTADYQYALWELFTPTVTLPSANAQTLLNNAAYNVAHAGSSNNTLYSELRIYTPGAGFTSNQEFLQLAANSALTTLATPEPSPGITVGIGLAVIAMSIGIRRLLHRRVAPVTLGSNPRESVR